jgi:hypothetical protein
LRDLPKSGTFTAVKRACLTALVLIGPAITACSEGEAPTPPVATPAVTLNHDAAPAGSPLEIRYKFVVADGAQFNEDYLVFVHVMDVDNERMWDEDHEPAVPTTQWKPGQTIEYTRTVFVPVFPYVGEASLHLGLYSRTTGDRLPLNGDHVGQNAYRVATVQLLPQTDNLLTVFREGWHQAEVAGDNATIEWQWTKKEATLAFKNPKKGAVFYLDADSPGSPHHGPQQVQIVIGGQVADTFTLTGEERVLRKTQLTPAQIGDADMAELRIRVDKSWIPSQVPAANSSDKRELGIRVFHAFVDPR